MDENRKPDVYKLNCKGEIHMFDFNFEIFNSISIKVKEGF